MWAKRGQNLFQLSNCLFYVRIPYALNSLCLGLSAAEMGVVP